MNVHYVFFRECVAYCIVVFPTIKYRTQPASCFLSKTLRTQSGHNCDMFESREKTLRMALILHFRASFPDIHTYCPDNFPCYSYISTSNICIPMFPVIPFWRLKKTNHAVKWWSPTVFFVPEISGDFWCLTPPLAGDFWPLFMVETGEAHTFSSVLLRKNYTRSCVTDVPGLKHDKIQTNIYIIVHNIYVYSLIWIVYLALRANNDALRKFHDNSLNETNLGPLFDPNVPTAPAASIATLQGLYAQLKVWEECGTSSDPKNWEVATQQHGHLRWSSTDRSVEH